MSIQNYQLDLDRSLPQTMRDQAREAIIAAIRAGRPGFCVGDHLTNQELSRQNGIHRNTLAAVIDDLVRLGFLRRLPNKGFEVVQASPERPQLLTQHILSLLDIAQRDDIDSRSQLIAAETGYRQASQLTGDFARVKQDLSLASEDTVSVLARSRLTHRRNTTEWKMVSIEQSFFPTALTPGLLENALHQIQEEGDLSIHRQLRRIFPTEDFFKAQYEISLLSLPKNLAKSWEGSTSSLISIVSITYCSKGPVEMTRTWFDATQAVLTAGSLDVKLIDPDGAH
jgi:DNA-binding GntR family transcriptional regulator